VVPLDKKTAGDFIMKNIAYSLYTLVFRNRSLEV